MNKRKGIILKNYIPQRYKLTIFDEINGKMEASIKNNHNPDRLKTGMIVHYHISLKKTVNQLEEIDIIDAPFELVRENIYFLHHIIELCCYFLPYNNAAPRIFKMLYFLLNFPEFIRYSIDKKIIIMQLFADLGIYPENEWLMSLCLESEIDNLKSEKYNDLNQQQLQLIDEWIMHCIMMHPDYSKFKTLPLRYDDE